MSAKKKGKKNQTKKNNTTKNNNISTKEKNAKIKDNNLSKKTNESNLEKKAKISSKESSKKNELKSKEEEIVFKNSKAKKESVSKLEENKDKNISLDETIDKEKKEAQNKDIKNVNKHKKKVIIIGVLTVLLVFILIFSICFALIHVTKDTIARGVSIRNIDISNLTYNEAKSKLEDKYNLALNTSINLKYEDFSYVIAAADINLNYDLNDALNQAYNIGRGDNLVQNNYTLLKTAIFNKNIECNFSFDEDALNTIIEYVSTNVPNLVKQYSYYIDGTNLIIIPGVDGIEVDSEGLKNLIIDKIQNRNLQDLSENGENDVIEIPYKKVTAKSIDIEAIYNEVKSEPQDAYYVEATENTEFELHPDVDGIDFAISLDEAKNIISEIGKTEYVIPLTITKANITVNEIGIEAFPYELSKFETTYDASFKGRSENLRIAASKINGTVLMPGEQFSFNGVVGERTVSEGYQDAAIYSNGQVVQGLAGGICQISSTLYNVALLANLQIDERYNHSFTTSYVKAGRDATVVYGVKDLKFTNTREYPIKITASVSGGVCTFAIYGIKQNEYEVKILPQTTQTTPYTTQTIVDSSLAPGARSVMQAGANGCKVTTYKEVYLNGVQISREEISNDTYQVMTRIVKVGPSVN